MKTAYSLVLIFIFISYIYDCSNIMSVPKLDVLSLESNDESDRDQVEPKVAT